MPFKDWWMRLRRRPELLPSKAAYARWSKAYPPVPHNRFMELEQETLLKLLPSLAGLHVLDLACGTGRWGQVALQQGAAQVVSIDSSPHMLRAGKPPLAVEGIMSQIPLQDACMEVAICGLAIGHVVTPRMWSTLGEMARVLRPSGVILVSDVHPTQAWHGAQRTFEDDGHTIAVEHYIHSYADYHAAAKAVGLSIIEVREVSVELGKPPVLLALKFAKGEAQT